MSWDVIIIGSGAGGSTAAWALARAGRRVLVLERGDFLPREHENWDPDAIRTGRYRTTEQWLDEHGAAFSPFTHYCVGGNTKAYGAALLRLRERDFGEIRHRAGISPAWPIGYDELEPYYSLAEDLYAVHGERGVDPTEPPAAGPYPFPPIPPEPRIARLRAALEGQGLRPFPLPLAVRLPGDRMGVRAPVRLARFDGFPDPTGTKADAEVVALQPALDGGRVALRTGALVERLLTDARGGHVTGVVVRLPDGGHQTLHADVVMLAAGAVNSAAVMLRSNGLGNAHDQVGRGYMTHHNGALIAITGTPNGLEFQKTLGLTDFYAELGTVQMMGKSDPADLAGLIADVLPGRDPADAARCSLDFWLTAEDLPDPDNRVAIAPEGRIQITYRPTNLGAYEGLERALRDVLDRVADPGDPFTYVGYRLGISGVSHQCGTLRMGTDPRTSVVDRHCRVHGVDNLFVCDASVFPSSGAVNPALTIMANALRVAEHVATEAA